MFVIREMTNTSTFPRPRAASAVVTILRTR